jgi:sterol O-acyltransferase
MYKLTLPTCTQVWQTAYLAGFIWWTYHRDWPWTHTVFMVLHCLTMLMKQHSYASYNGYCKSIPEFRIWYWMATLMMTVSELYKKRDLLKGRLERLEESGSHGSVSSSYSLSTPKGLVSEITTLRRQNKRRISSEFKSIHATRDTDHLLSLSETIENGTALEPAQLMSLRSLLTKEIQLLSEGLQGQFSTHNQYPRNLTVGNFCEFITLPTLVYELEYPRTERIDWAYVAEKVVATFATIFVMIVVSQYWIYPVVMKTVEMKEQGLTVQQRLQEFPWVLSDLLFPFMMEYLLAFYVIWECVVSITSPLCCLFELPH